MSVYSCLLIACDSGRANRRRLSCDHFTRLAVATTVFAGARVDVAMRVAVRVGVAVWTDVAVRVAVRVDVAVRVAV